MDKKLTKREDYSLIIEKAKKAIVEIETIEEAKEHVDKSAALRKYAEGKNIGLDGQNAFTEYNIRAERRAGQFLIEMAERGERKGKGQPKKEIGRDTPFLLKDFDFNPDMSKRCQRLARIPEKEFEGKIVELKKGLKELTKKAFYILSGSFRGSQEVPIDVILPKDSENIIKFGDFKEILKDQPDNSVDMIFTDPLYAKEFIGNYEDLAKVAQRVLKPGCSLITYVGHYAIPEVLNLMTPYLRFWWIIALKQSGASARLPGKWIFVEWKPLLWFVKEHRRDQNFVSDLFDSDNPPDKYYHKMAQGLGEAELFIEKLTEPGDLVLDPFCGSGTTLIAAHGLKRIPLGIEMNKEEYLLAKKRIKKYLEKQNG